MKMICCFQTIKSAEKNFTSALYSLFFIFSGVFSKQVLFDQSYDEVKKMVQLIILKNTNINTIGLT